VKMKAEGSFLYIQLSGLSHDCEMNPPKRYPPSFSLMMVRVGPLLSQHLWKSAAANPSLDALYRSLTVALETIL